MYILRLSYLLNVAIDDVGGMSESASARVHCDEVKKRGKQINVLPRIMRNGLRL